MVKEKKMSRTYGGYITTISLMRAIGFFLPDVKIPDDVKGKYNIKQHNMLVSCVAKLLIDVENNALMASQKNFHPSNIRDYPVPHKDTMHIYENSYYEFNRLLGFSSIQKETFFRIMKTSVNRILHSDFKKKLSKSFTTKKKQKQEEEQIQPTFAFF